MWAVDVLGQAWAAQAQGGKACELRGTAEASVPSWWGLGKCTGRGQSRVLGCSGVHLSFAGGSDSSPREWEKSTKLLGRVRGRRQRGSCTVEAGAGAGSAPSRGGQRGAVQGSLASGQGWQWAPGAVGPRGCQGTAGRWGGGRG